MTNLNAECLKEVRKARKTFRIACADYFARLFDISLIYGDEMREKALKIVEEEEKEELKKLEEAV